MSYLLVFATFLITCALEARVFTIPEGSHESSPNIVKAIYGDKLTISVVFDDSARYVFPPQDEIEQADTNKLYGFSDCRDHHMTNSARFGWRWFNNELQIMAFTHYKKEKRWQYITSISPNRPYNGSIELNHDKRRYIYTFDGVTVEAERGCDHSNFSGYHLKPYFGGTLPAPHEVKIKVDVKNDFGPAVVSQPYPNPGQGAFKLKVTTFERVQFYVKIYDISGRHILDGAKTRLDIGKDQEVSINYKNRFPGGIYVIKPVVVLADGSELQAATHADAPNVLKLLIL